jgi:hypothetical protein
LLLPGYVGRIVAMASSLTGRNQGRVRGHGSYYRARF